MQESKVKHSSKDIIGGIAEAIARLAALPEGRALSAVLQAVEPEVRGAKVKVSGDMHRASVDLVDGKLAAVRVTTAKSSRPGAVPTLRFKPPRNTSDFAVLYFGGLDGKGRAVVHKRKPHDIGTLKTLTLRCGGVE
jgi:hypothetical protein